MKLTYLFLVFSAVFVGTQAKPVKKKYGTTQNGKMPEDLRQKMAAEIQLAQNAMTDEHYAEVVYNPEKARNDQEKLASLAAREVFVLVDRSGSMTIKDKNPTGAQSFRTWTRWNSARVAAEALAEVSLSIDSDNSVDVMLWDGEMGTGLRKVYKKMTNVGDIATFFETHHRR